ncbi:6-phosphofructokinase 1 [Desulfonispora thiosulfatigenes DSM 11270]|uniref:Pyrophosphate--fructose 6-phosphate 1-phosphotransferase n=1 Tax=Desulfonispora thiosulfatigenes DSM 11270 TaxID=656914 RepID=A0A1W1V451_DESTI|nr:diphosphate--fructose-6-phosphate 1-phosphotransferase [Desulfonispora thiosulfatigenes]SMB88060.1 6-phosphofructokinase 1 [Desulfonispora thiosulfatigenes DSM 11270]
MEKEQEVNENKQELNENKKEAHEKLQGNLLIGQGGGPTSVINASLAGILSKAKQNEGIHNIFGLQNGLEGIFVKELFTLSKEDDEFIEKLKYTPGAILGSSSYKVDDPDKEAELIKFFKDNNIKYFIYIGGQDSMKSLDHISKVAKKSEYDLKVIGVPKAIDNDIPITDHCPGYASAARFIAESTIGAGRDLEATKSYDDVAIMEVMGRNSGWLAAASSLGRKTVDDAPHLIYLPEKEFNEEKFLQDVKEIYEELQFIFIVISEGIKDTEGKLIADKDPEGPAKYLTKLLYQEMGLKGRVHKLGAMQRSFAFSTSQIDVDEAFMVGQQAVTDLENGWSDIMITLDRASGKDYYVVTGRTHLAEAIKETKNMPKYLINPEGNFVTYAYYQYAYPLLGKELPNLARLSGIPVILT